LARHSVLPSYGEIVGGELGKKAKEKIKREIFPEGEAQECITLDGEAMIECSLM
jgi:hypothetical protein